MVMTTEDAPDPTRFVGPADLVGYLQAEDTRSDRGRRA